MSKILFLDVYKNTPFRISKDTNGGYGTCNDLGSGLFPYLLSRIAKFSIFWPTVNTLNLISELLRCGHEVAYSNSSDDFDNSIDFVFLPISIVSFNTERDAIKKLINKNHNIKIFCYGSFVEHAKDLLNHPNVSLIFGEPEFLAINQKLNSSNLNLLHEVKHVHSPYGDPDLLAPSLWADLDLPSMRHFLHGNLSESAPIIATRGCPYSCAEYCTYPLQQGSAPRSVSPEKLIEDINYISKNRNVKNYIFRDPVFTINKKYSKALLLEIDKKLNKNFNFTIETHLNNMNDDMIELAKNANITQIKFGIESSSEEVLSDVKRYNIAKEKQVDRIEKLKKAKMRTTAFYILCQPSDTRETIVNTVNYAKELKTNLAQFSLFTPYPGTPYYKKIKDKILTNNFEKFTQFDLVFKHDLFSPKQAKSILGYAYQKYYLGIAKPNF